MTRRNEKNATQPESNNPVSTKPSVRMMGKQVALLPHERDEATDEATDGATSGPRKVMKQAASDLDNGLKDTDRSAEVNRTYQKLKIKP